MYFQPSQQPISFKATFETLYYIKKMLKMLIGKKLIIPGGGFT